MENQLNLEMQKAIDLFAIEPLRWQCKKEAHEFLAKEFIIARITGMNDFFIPLEKEKWPKNFQLLYGQLTVEGKRIWPQGSNAYIGSDVPNTTLFVGYAFYLGMFFPSYFFGVLTREGGRFSCHAIDPIATRNNITPDAYFGVNIPSSYIHQGKFPNEVLQNYVMTSKGTKRHTKNFINWTKQYEVQKLESPGWFL